MIPIQHAYDYFAAAGASLDYCRTTDGLEAEGACLPKVHVYEVDEMQAEHDKIGTSTRMVTKEFPALEGFRIISWEWVSASSANSSEVVLTPIGDGGSLRMNVALSSGPFYDRWRGWVSGKILTKQEQVGCGGEGQPQE
jgi:hypothetical protein